MTLGNRESPEAELLIPLCSKDVRELYNNAKPMNGARWLMIPVRSREVFEDVKRLIALRVQKKRA